MVGEKHCTWVESTQSDNLEQKITFSIFLTLNRLSCGMECYNTAIFTSSFSSLVCKNKLEVASKGFLMIQKLVQ